MSRAPTKLRLQDRRRRASSFKLILYGVLAVLIVVGVAYGVRRPEVSVASVSVEGATRVNSDDVKALAEKSLSGSYLFLVPKKMSFVVPTGAISAKIKAAFPEVATVSVSVKNLTDLHVTLTERGAFALWCRTGTCFDMDTTGYIFDQVESGSTTLRTYEGSIDGSPVGATFLPQKFAALDSFITRVEVATKHHIGHISVTDDQDVFAQFDGGGEIRFVMDKQDDATITNIASVFASPALNAGRPMEYADFRFDNKASVKFSK
jgi:hypothetical protein